jgi:predicted permease
MNALAHVRSLIAKFFRRSATAQEMEEELSAHIAYRADDLERGGLCRAEAERRARIEFGGREHYREESYAALGGNLMQTFLQDLRFATRILRRSPGFATAAVLTLALAIGANAVVFALLNGLFLHPLNVADSRSLYSLQRGTDTYIVQSYPDYIDLRDQNRTFETLAAYNITHAGLDTGQNPTNCWFYTVSGNYFDTLHQEPYLGRVFHRSDEHGLNSAPYIVLSYAFWHAHFQDDRSIVGRVVRLNKHPFTILGVANPGFQGTLMFFTPDFFVPIVNQQEIDGWNNLNTRGNRSLFEVLGHLKPGVTPRQAVADLNSIGSYLEKLYPKEDEGMTFSLVRPGLHGDFFAPAVRAFLVGLMLLAGLILLAACANLGSLFAARAADRAREVALRLALGARRNRILRQLFTEAILISLAGGAVGLCCSVALLRGLASWRPFPEFPIHIAVSPDANVYMVALFLAIFSGILFGVVPVRQVLQTSPYEVVKSVMLVPRRARFCRWITVRELLLAVQIALCAVLVTSSMVAVRGLMRSLHSSLGFNPHNAVLVQTDLAQAGYSDEQIPAMQRRMIDGLRALPGVSQAGLVSIPPLHMGWAVGSVFSEQATDLRDSNAVGDAIQYQISPEYLEAAQTTLLSGRGFTVRDNRNTPPVAIVNKEFARAYLGSEAGAVGKHFKIRDHYKTTDAIRVEVVGVVENGKYTANLAEDQQAAMFLPILQSPASDTWIVVRSSIDPQQLPSAIHETLRTLDAALPAFIQPWHEEMNGALFGSRMATLSLGVLGIMGAMLSITGIFGMAAYSVSKRLKELGIRVALGATRREVLAAALGRAEKLLAFGSAAGLILGVLASRVLALIVYQATPRDPVILAGVVMAMALLGLVATWLPAQRALSVNPLVLLREE